MTSQAPHLFPWSPPQLLALESLGGMDKGSPVHLPAVLLYLRNCSLMKPVLCFPEVTSLHGRHVPPPPEEQLADLCPGKRGL